MTDRITPDFLLSLSRSGSTLLQRILGSHPEMSTVSEPWLLLPAFYALRPAGVRSEYGHRYLSSAIIDFCNNVPGGINAYYDAVKTMALDLYSQASEPGSRYFLDKTPRYHLIAGELLDVFPEGKFILLWRNPLAVVASIIETWHKGKWLPYLHETDLFGGLERLIGITERHHDRVHILRFEDLINSPEETIGGICRHLDLPFHADMIQNLELKELSGRMGDPSTDGSFHDISEEPLKKWHQIMTGYVRKSWCRKYLTWIGAARLETMGYDPVELLNELNSIRTHMDLLFPDILRTFHGHYLKLTRKDFLE